MWQSKSWTIHGYCWKTLYARSWHVCNKFFIDKKTSSRYAIGLTNSVYIFEMLWDVCLFLSGENITLLPQSRTKALCCQSSSIAEIFDKNSENRYRSTPFGEQNEKNKQKNCRKSICFHTSSTLNSECVFISKCLCVYLRLYRFVWKFIWKWKMCSFMHTKKSQTHSVFLPEIPFVLACLWWWRNFALVFQHEYSKYCS